MIWSDPTLFPKAFFRATTTTTTTVATLPSALSMSVSSLGASWVFSFQPVLPPDFRPLLPSRRWKLGQALDAVTGTRRLNFGLLALCFLVLGSKLRRGRQRDLSLVAQWFVRFPTDPQPMQQHRQLSRHRDHRSFLPILSPSLRQFQSPPS